MSAEKAVEAMKNGKPLLLFDGEGREGETDIVFHASCVGAGEVRLLRKDAGGLICLATDENTATLLGLPFIAELLPHSLRPLAYDKTPYGDPPAFSIPINHRETFTGISDSDRSLTIRAFAELLEKGGGRGEFLKTFRSPGHVALLIGRGLGKRRGHTELALELAGRAGMVPAVVMCEMLGNGKSLSKEKAIAFGKRRGMPLVEGKEL